MPQGNQRSAKTVDNRCGLGCRGFGRDHFAKGNKMKIACLCVGMAMAGAWMAAAGELPSATFIANWNGDTGTAGLDGDFPPGWAVAKGLEGVPGPVITTSGKYGAGAIDLTDVAPEATSADNPSLKYLSKDVVDPNIGTVMFWVRHEDVPANHTIRYFYAEFPKLSNTNGFLQLSKTGQDSLNRLNFTVYDGSGYQYHYLDGGWSAINDQQFHHLCITWNNTTDTVGIYIHDQNGNLQLSKVSTINSWSMALPDTNSTFWVADNDYLARGPHGVLDDYAISSDALNVDQIKAVLASEASPVPPPVGAGRIPAATFIANWNGDMGTGGLNANYPVGWGASGLEGTPGPAITTSGKYGAGAIDLTDVFPKTTSADNPSIKFLARDVVHPNTGSVMFWIRHGTILSGDEMRYFYYGDNDGHYFSLSKHATLDRMYFTIGDGSGFRYFYMEYGWSALNDSKWHHVAVTWDNATGTICMYIHNLLGKLQISKTAVVTGWAIKEPDADDCFFVADNDFHARGANGVLDDYSISREVLTLSQIETALLSEAVRPPPHGTAILFR